MSTVVREQSPITTARPVLPPLEHTTATSPLPAIGQSVLSALEALLANKLRSLLTMLGIIIGVGAVIVVVAIGQGASAQVQQNLSRLGTNVVSVFPGNFGGGGVNQGSGTRPTLTVKDLAAIEANVPNIAAITPLVEGNAQVIAGQNNWNTQIQAAYPAESAIGNYTTSEGAFYTQDDEDSGALVAVIGQTVATNLFPNSDPIGQEIRIRNVTFRVVGLLSVKGAAGFGDPDNIIFIPFSTGQRRLFASQNVQQIQMQVDKTENIDSVIANITSVLRTQHHITGTKANDFTARNQQQFVATQQQTTQTITLLLASVAGVSLLVGGIGIMNIMLVSVTERTREIGIRMAIGARGRDVLLQFLVEAATLAVIGGILGIILGAASTIVVSRLAGWSTLISPASVLVSFAFAALIGVFFGFYPARQAAKLDPIVALRSE